MKCRCCAMRCCRVWSAWRYAKAGDI